MSTTTEWNPRYVAYAAAHGNTPEAQRLADKNMASFLAWLRTKWAEFDAAHPALRGRSRMLSTTQEAFDAWLTTNPQE